MPSGPVDPVGLTESIAALVMSGVKGLGRLVSRCCLCWDRVIVLSAGWCGSRDVLA